MKQRALLVTVFIFWSFCGFSQEFQNFDYYYAHPLVSEEAKEYFARPFDINNTEKTYAIIDSVFTKNDDTRPFYIYLTCQMLNEADADLLPELNIICRNAAELYPVSLLSVLYAGQNYVDEQYKDMWAHRMAVEIRITCNSELMTCFKKSRSIALANCDGAQKSRLEVLYNMVRKDMDLFQQR